MRLPSLSALIAPAALLLGAAATPAAELPAGALRVQVAQVAQVVDRQGFVQRHPARPFGPPGPHARRQRAHDPRGRCLPRQQRWSCRTTTRTTGA